MFRIGGHPTWMYVRGNYSEDLSSDDQWELVTGEIEHNKNAIPFAVALVTTDSAEDAYEKVLASCGATLPKRDSVDFRMVEQVRTGTGDFIDSQQDVGGWPELQVPYDDQVITCFPHRHR